MTVQELIVKLLDMPQHLNILVEVNHGAEYEEIEVFEMGGFGEIDRVLLQIEGVDVDQGYAE